MWQLFALLAGIIVFMVVAAGVRYGLGSPPWVPVWKKDLPSVMAAADIQAGETLIDLGSGDGRVLLAAAARGATVIGVEASILLVWLSQWRLHRAGFKSRSRVVLGDLFAVDLSSADVVVTFLNPTLMARLESRLAELKPGARWVSYAFAMPATRPTREIRTTPSKTPVFVYRVDA